MDVSKISSEERAYLLGLYLTDGYMNKRRKSTREIGFCLQGNEGEIANRVAELFSRSGLVPRTYQLYNGNQLRVVVVGANLLSFLPDKDELLHLSIDDATVKKFISTERLDGDFGIPFIGGLLDGDGCCSADYYTNRKCIFGFVCKRWSFAQTKFPFLVDFIASYACNLVRDGVSLTLSRHSEKRLAWILESGRKAFVHAGIAKWSVKVARYQTRVEEISKVKSNDRSSFLKPFEVAKRLHASQGSIRRWCKLGYIKHMRIRSASSRKRNHSYLVPEDQVRLVEEKVLRTGTAVMDKSPKPEERLITMKETARLLGYAVSTVFMHCKKGEIRFIPFSTLGGKKKYLIPTNEVERLSKKHEERH
jgi:hypothetical protein